MTLGLFDVEESVDLGDWGDYLLFVSVAVRVNKESKNAAFTASPRSDDTTDTGVSGSQSVCVTSVCGQVS